MTEPLSTWYARHPSQSVDDPMINDRYASAVTTKLAVSPRRRYNVERMATERVTWDEAQLMPEDGRRYEAVGGELYVTPAPTPRHQRISFLLAVELYRLLEAPGHGRVYPAPVGVEFPDSQEGVQPDIIFISSERLHLIGESAVRGAPDLVVEIASPSTAERDRTIKRKLYQRKGVAQYWIVDPDATAVEVWDFAAGTKEGARYTDRLPVRLRGRRGTEIDPGGIDLKRILRPRS